MRAVAVVLAGGTNRRFGGADKTAAALGDGTVAGTLLDSLPAAVPAVVVGPDVGGGPAAGLAAGAARAEDAHGAGAHDGRGPDVVVALAGDLPLAGSAVPRLLAALAADPDADAAIAVDPGGRRQFLLAAYRRGPLLAALGPAPADRAMRDVVAPLRVVEVPVSEREALDVDTRADLARAADLVANRTQNPHASDVTPRGD
jgi:molybdopterin-guanine dinucleotide biosynthesis protein A